MDKIVQDFGLLFPVGFLLAVIAYPWFIVNCFRAHWMWGLAVLFTLPLTKLGVHPDYPGPTGEVSFLNFVPFLVILVFVVKNWRYAVRPLVLFAVGAGFCIMGSMGIG